MNSSATASYSWSGVWRAKTFPEGKQIVAAIKMQPKNCLKRSFTTAAQPYTTLWPLPKILDERISDRSQTQIKDEAPFSTRSIRFVGPRLPFRNRLPQSARRRARRRQRLFADRHVRESGPTDPPGLCRWKQNEL